MSGKDIESAYWELVVKDIQDAYKLVEPIYDQRDGGDGYVSVEVSPRLADNTEGTIEAAKYLHKVVDRPNVYIKIPATASCITSIKELIFSLARYEAVIDAYSDGLEASGLSDLSRVTSVASFFVSRVDTLIDKLLEKIGTPEALDLRGKAAVAQAALAYQLYQKKFSGPRWEALAKKGARKQRLLWASTSVKNPAYPDTLYVAPLIGPDTVSTMPDQALLAFIDHGTVSRTIDTNVSEAEGIYSALEKLGIDWAYIGSQLEDEGVESFKKSFDSRLDTLQEKANSLKSEKTIAAKVLILPSFPAAAMDFSRLVATIGGTSVHRRRTPPSSQVLALQCILLFDSIPFAHYAWGGLVFISTSFACYPLFAGFRSYRIPVRIGSAHAIYATVRIVRQWF
ncbi:Transaldolase [Hibiscus syriacus]|uniref:Transaldolase n=1 Tax=Hibiscus syriacus TaxID=106335 RepID=A0A6A2Z9B9_HIBSY|nr:Transaldolase [Hibiscus syriacus]